MSTWNKKERADFDTRRKNYDLGSNSPNEYLPSSGQGQTVGMSPFNAKNHTLRKFKTSPTDENRRPDCWVGGFSPVTEPQRRSWRVKSIRDAIPEPNLDS